MATTTTGALSSCLRPVSNGALADRLCIMTNAARRRRKPVSRSPLLELPSELRPRVYSFLHEYPEITFEQLDPHYTRDADDQEITRIQRVNFESPYAEALDYLDIIEEDYDWRYLLSCRTIYQEAQYILPQILHLRVRSFFFNIEHIPAAVRARYLPHIPFLTIVAQYPVYHTVFDGSQLRNLKRLCLAHNTGTATVREHYTCAFPPPADVIARIRGACDHEYIQRCLRNIEVSRLK